MALRALPSPTRPAGSVRIDLAVADVRDGNRTVVALAGEADLSNRSVVADVLSRVIASSDDDVVIDLADVEFVDTATVRLFCVAKQLLDGRGRALTFRSPSRLVARMLGFFGLADLIETRERSEP